MGNILRKLCKKALDHGDGGEVGYGTAPLGAHGGEVGFAALARDLHQFQLTGKVPSDLSNHVQSSVTAQANWYKKLLISWNAAKPPPKNAKEASDLIINTLKGHRKADVQGFLSFYGLLSPSVPVSAAAPLKPWPKGIQYELISLTVASKDVADGDTITIYVDVAKDTRQSVAPPPSVLQAFKKWKLARRSQDLATANALEKEIKTAGYKYNLFSFLCRPLFYQETLFHPVANCRVIYGDNGDGEILACKYRVRLRGIDAPEKTMPYGAEAKAELVGLVEGEQLQLLVYTVDQYGRIVADVHCKHGFVQEILLKKGCVWHYTTYDKRPEFTKWEQQAREQRVGLWKFANPQEPWDYRKDHKQGA